MSLLLRLRLNKGRIALVSFFFVLELGLAYTVARFELLFPNTLHHNGNWIATKSSLGKPSMGAPSFFFLPQALEGGRLNLGAWYGCHEVIYRDPLTPSAITFSVRLERDAHAAAIFNHSDSGFSGVRLSSHRAFPSIYFEASATGEFLRTQPLTHPSIAIDRDQRVTITFDDEGGRVSVDARDLGRFDAEPPGRGGVGLRGGIYQAWIDDLRVEQRGGLSVSESFDYRDDFVTTLLIATGCLLGANLLLLFLILVAARERGRYAFYSLLTVNVTVLAMGMALLGVQKMRGNPYPALDALARAQEHEWKVKEVKTSVARMRRRFSEPPATGTHRTLLLGSSQTWGEGARTEAETFVVVSETLLNGGADGRRYECLNAGFPGFHAFEFIPYWNEDLRLLHPDLVVINLGHNDPEPALFETKTAELLAAIQDTGADVLLVAEAANPQLRPGETEIVRANHAIMRRLAEELELPLIDMNAHMAEHRDDGYQWWDRVHMSSFGQRLVAERLAPEIARIAAGEPASAERAEP